MKKTIQKYSAILTVFSLILVIFVAGCSGDSGPIQTGRSDSLRLSFETEGRNTFDSLENFIISVQARNVGEFDATNVRSRLMGYGGISSANDEVLSDFKSLNPSTIKTANDELALPEGTADVEWDVTAPFVSKDSPDREITVTGEVFYDTKSLASQRVVVATKEYIDRSESVPVSQSVQELNGPIEMKIQAGNPYVELSGTQAEFRVVISLENQGSGSVYNEDRSQYDYLNKVTLQLPEGIGIDANNCDFVLATGSGIASPKTLVIDNLNNPSKLRLTEGGSKRTLSCALTAHRNYVDGYNTFEVSSEAEYTYIQSVTKELTIKGVEVSPLSLNILAPKRTNKGPWVSESHQTLHVEVLHKDKRVTSGLDAESFKIWLGTELIGEQGDGVPSYVEYLSNPTYNGIDGEEQLPSCWEVTVYVPDMDVDGNSTFDLSSEVSYFGSDATDISPSSVFYEEL